MNKVPIFCTKFLFFSYIFGITNSYFPIFGPFLLLDALIECQTPDGKTSLQIFKIDTGANGNLMPISMFSKLFPKVSLEVLEKTVEKVVTLFACNNMPIRQFGTCSIRLSFKGNSAICRFFVIDHETAIIRISDSEKIKLVKVNFDMIKKRVKFIHEVPEESFKQKIESEYAELFKGIGLM